MNSKIKRLLITLLILDVFGIVYFTYFGLKQENYWLESISILIGLIITFISIALTLCNFNDNKYSKLILLAGVPLILLSTTSIFTTTILEHFGNALLLYFMGYSAISLLNQLPISKEKS